MDFALTGPDGQPLPTTPLTDKQAVDLADLRSMASDLDRVLRYCDELDRFDEHQEPVVRTAIAEAAVMTYGRCHISGKSSAHRRTRRVCPKTLIDDLPPELREAHERVMELRNREVGHKVGAGEHCAVLAVQHQPSGPVVQVATMLTSFLFDRVEGLRELATEVLQRVRELDAREEVELMKRLRERGVS